MMNLGTMAVNFAKIWRDQNPVFMRAGDQSQTAIAFMSFCAVKSKRKSSVYAGFRSNYFCFLFLINPRVFIFIFS